MQPLDVDGPGHGSPTASKSKRTRTDFEKTTGSLIPRYTDEYAIPRSEEEKGRRRQLEGALLAWWLDRA
jgi:hypothetical protein